VSEARSIIENLPGFSKQEAQRIADLCRDLLRSPGWEYLQGILRRSKADWEAVLRSEVPVGKGAATLARAQGALIAIDQALTLPETTLRRCVERIQEPD
jgi:hypothetical protein